MTVFDDFLGLAGRNWSSYRLILFHGRSGSGKSTAIRYLLEHAFRDRPVLVIDEVATPRDLIPLRKLLAGQTTTLIATHIHPAWFRLISAAPCIAFRTDRGEAKIMRYLARQGIRGSQAAVAEYVRRFGATYTDADLIMERYPAPSFDLALSRFLKFDRLG